MFANAEQVYEASTSVLENGVRVLSVRSARHLAFAKSTMALNSFGEEKGIPERLAPLINYMKRCNFLMSTTPLPLDTIIKHLKMMESSLSAPLQYLLQNDEARRAFAPLKEAFEELKEKDSKQSPLWEAFVETAVDSQTVFVSIDARTAALYAQFVKVRQAELRILSDYTVLGLSALRENTAYSRIVVFGSPKLISMRGGDFVFSASRSPDVSLVCFEHYYSDLPPVSRLASSEHGSNIPISTKLEIREVTQTGLRETNVDGPPFEPGLRDFVLPTLNPQTIAAAAGGFSEGRDSEYDCEIAKLFVLADESAVFVSAEGSCTLLEVKTDAAGPVGAGIYLKKTSEIEVGDIILLNTHGVGDTVVPIANGVLGADANKLRNLQGHWKQLLREQVSKVGSESVLRELGERGATDANKANLRTWCRRNPRSIAPGLENSFEAILNFLGLGPQKNEFLSATAEIRRAHKVAGRFVSRKIRESVVGSHLDRLMKEGRQEFKLEGLDDSASQTAFIIEQRYEEEQMVDTHKVGAVFTIEQHLWQ